MWISAGWFGDGPAIVLYPRGGRCGRCDTFRCREHFGPAHGSDRRGTRRGIVTVSANRPKHVDPDGP